jgi:hypothetical protein
MANFLVRITAQARKSKELDTKESDTKKELDTKESDTKKELDPKEFKEFHTLTKEFLIEVKKSNLFRELNQRVRVDVVVPDNPPVGNVIGNTVEVGCVIFFAVLVRMFKAL